jgi:hypothetical protein
MTVSHLLLLRRADVIRYRYAAADIGKHQTAAANDVQFALSELSRQRCDVRLHGPQGCDAIEHPPLLRLKPGEQAVDIIPCGGGIMHPKVMVSNRISYVVVLCAKI